MFSILKRKRTRPQSYLQQQVKTGLQVIWNKAKKGFAGYLTAKTEHLSVARLKKYLYVFCTICSAGCIGIFLYPFLEPSVPANLPSNIRFPDHTGMQKEVKDSSITYHQYRQVLLLEKRLDSLQYSGKNKAGYDSLIHKYPGLRDSILLFKQLYRNQSS